MIQARLRAFMLLLSDFLTLAAVWLLVACIYRFFGGSYEMTSYYRVWPILFIYGVIAASFNLYHGNLIEMRLALDPVEELRYVVRSVFITYLFFLAYLTASRQSEEYSRLVCVVSAFGSLLLLIPMRNLTRYLLSALHVGGIPFYLLGRGAASQHLLDCLHGDTHYALECAGIFSSPDEITTEALRPSGKKAGKAHVQLLLCCYPQEELQQHFHALAEHFPHIVFLQDGRDFPILWEDTACICHEMSGMQFRNCLLMPLPRITKSVLEYATALLLAVVVLPMMAVIALCVRFSSRGPVFYRAHRLGQNGESITILKFRTMYADADKKLSDLLAANPELQREWDENVKLTHDPRVTPLGRLLRKTSLDELPQFFDVLAGRIALIGPRPIVEEEVPKYAENYRYLKQVKPGITGLWQVSGRSDTDYPQRVALDMWYIRRWSVWLDLYIFFATIGSVIRCKGAK